MQDTTTRSQQLFVDQALQDILTTHAAAHADLPAEAMPPADRADPLSAPVPSFFYRLTQRVEHMLRPRVTIGGRSYSAYNLFGVAGMVLAAAIALSLTYVRGLSLPLMVSLLLVALGLSVIHIVFTVLRTGKDSLVFLRYFLSIMAVSALVLRIIEQPILPYLENLMLGIGAMQGIGRIGCLRVGCCYGKPARYGIRYTLLHARAGFPAPLVGVRLIPVQLVESAWVLCSSGIGICLALLHPVTGYGLASYLVLFSSGRFCLEFLRGDTARPYMASFSEAQWISLLIVFATLIGELFGFLPLVSWHMALGGVLASLALFVRGYYRHTGPAQLRSPLHLGALAQALQRLQKGRTDNLTGPHAVHIRKTPSGLQISDGIYTDDDTHIHHYTISNDAKALPVADAVAVSNLLRSWHDGKEKAKLIHQNSNTFHILSYRSIKS